MKLATTILVFCVAFLLALGLVMLYSAKMTQGGSHYLGLQLAWCGLGMVGCALAASLDYRRLRSASWLPWVLMGITVALLVLVLIPGLGVRIDGFRRWLDLGGARFQPSEFAKLALILVLAWYGDRYQRRMHTFKHGLGLPGCFIGLVLGLILLEPDFGTTMLLAAVSGVMLLLSGVRWRHVLPAATMALGAFSYLVWHDPVRRERILAFLDPEKYRDGVGYQPWQAMLALGSGGWVGEGLGNSRQKLGFVPEHHTDFIAAVIGEELGLLALLAVVLAFCLMLVCGIFISWKCRDGFGQLLAAGISFLIGFQGFINLGVVTSVLPNKGLSLPFISYGGSNLILMLTAVGLLLGIAMRNAEALAGEPEALPGKLVPVAQWI